MIPPAPPCFVWQSPCFALGNPKIIQIKTYERKSEQAHIPHAPTLLENAVYNEWQFQALVTGNRTKKGYKLFLKRIKSAFPVKMHIYTLCPS